MATLLSNAARVTAPTFDEDAEKVRLADFRFRLHERYFYESDAAPTWVASLTSSSRPLLTL